MRTRWGLLALVGVLCAPAVSSAARGSLTARAAILMDAATGESLWERSADEPLPPASTTKVLTAIVAIESGRLDQSLRVSEHAAETDPSKIGLHAGQHMVLRDLLYAVLLNSANDAAEVVAEGVGGSTDRFAELMNQKARALGATSSHFVNPHGLTADGHVASARDLAKIFRGGLRLPLFREILSTRTARVPVEAAGVRMVSLRSHNRLLTGYTYPVIGKTGYPLPARRCFVGAARHDGREIIVAVLGASDLWGDARRLIEMGFGENEQPSATQMAAAPAAGRPRRGRQAVVASRPARRKPSDARAARRARVSAEGDDDATDAHPSYVVQLGPYPTHAAAMGARSRLIGRGYSATLHGYSVRVGGYATRPRALEVVERLRASGYRTAVLALR